MYRNLVPKFCHSPLTLHLVSLLINFLMMDLQNDFPWLYKEFTKHGFHTVRRSERYWSGLWTDLVIEQVLMRSVKSRGGLTRGRGMTESVRLQWVHSAHRTGAVHEAVADFTGLKTYNSEQHPELGKSRKTRDYADLCKITDWLTDHNPFSAFTVIRSYS